MEEPDGTLATDATPEPDDVGRRKALRLTGGAIALVLAGGVGWLSTGPRGRPMSLAAAFAALDRLDAAVDIKATGEWRPYRIFSHVAQSIEMSMTGYPRHESALFKNTLGATAFSVFRKTGRMRHDLSEPIPGAPVLEVDGDLKLALQRLRTALVDFDSFEGDLQPHFAYGALSKSQYAAAHVMHLNNHLAEITV